MENEILLNEELVEGNASNESEAAEKTVPLSALHKEREEKRRYRDDVKRYRPIIDRLMSSTGARTPEELISRMDGVELSRRMKERGVDEDTAREMLRIEEENRSLKGREAAMNFDRDINELSANPMYADIADVRDDVEEFARDRGMSIKEAYNALFAEDRARKLIEQAKADAVASKELRDSKKIAGLSQSGNSSASGGGAVKLSPAELSIAKAAGMTPQEYFDYKNS